MLTKAALTMPRDISSGSHLNQGFRLGFMQGPGQQGRFDMPPEETADLEELEEFSKMFKQKRIKLGMYLIFINQTSIPVVALYILTIIPFLFCRLYTGRCWSGNGKTLWQ